MEKHIRIAIDGPSGAGKSTLAKKLAARYGLVYVDTGALYRTVGLYVRRQDIDPDNAERIAAALNGVEVSVIYREGSQRVLLNGEDVTDLLRTPEATEYSSRVSVHPEVRAYLLETQRKIARENSVVMDGRDIGTVVLPDAELKIYLHAAPEDRARRRYEEQMGKGITQSYEDVLREVLERDLRDTTRAESPLKRADDAVDVDTTGNTLEESEAAMIAVFEKRFGRDVV